MKRKIILIIIILHSIFFYAQEFMFCGLEGSFTKDKKDPFRYSMYKALDDENETSFAFPIKKQSAEQLVFLIETRKHQFVDGIYIKNGYYDSSFYNQNYRIKKIRIYFGNANINKCEYEEILLKDTNDETYYSFSKPYEIKRFITVTATDLFSSSKYEDICITEFGFTNENKCLKNKFYLTSGSNNYAIYENGKKDNVIVKNEYVNKTYNFSQYITGSINEGLITENYNYDTSLKNVIVKHFFENGNIKETIVSKENLPDKITKYYYRDNNLVSNDFGEYLYTNGRIYGFLNYNNTNERDTFFPSFIIQKNTDNNSVRLETYPADNPGRDGWIATWINLETIIN